MNKASGSNVFIEFDQDDNMYKLLINIMHHNKGRDWTTESVRCLNEVFLKQATHDVVYGLRQRTRTERLLNLKDGRYFLTEKPLHRTLRKNDIDMNPTYHSLTHPFAKAGPQLEAFQKQQLYGDAPHGVWVHKPYFWS